MFSRTTMKSTCSGFCVLERAQVLGVEPDRPQVHEQVEPEAHARDDPELEQPDFEARIADRAEQDRVVAADLLERRVGQDLLRLQVVLGAERVVGERHGEAVQRRDTLEHAQALAHDFGTDPVSGNHGDAVGLRHVVLLRGRRDGLAGSLLDLLGERRYGV